MEDRLNGEQRRGFEITGSRSGPLRQGSKHKRIEGTDGIYRVDVFVRLEAYTSLVECRSYGEDSLLDGCEA